MLSPSFVLRVASSRKRFASGLVVCALLASLLPAPAFAANEEATRIGGVDAVVWSSLAAPFDPQPVVVFSHAMHMCPTQSRYLMRALADAGYLVIAPRHADSNCRLSIPELSRNGWKPSLMWSDDDFRDRADDVRKLVAALPADARFKGQVDVGRLALVGHSLGGYTVLGLGGAWPSWKLPGVRAILAFTPYSLPFQRTGGLRKLSAPVMYQAGTLDQVFTLPLNLAGYDESPAPKYFVEFTTAAHLTWTDLSFDGHDEIVDYALAFFDHYVKGGPARPALRTKLPGVLKFAHAARSRSDLPAVRLGGCCRFERSSSATRFRASASFSRTSILTSPPANTSRSWANREWANRRCST